ncbi:MAG: sulfatase [Phycisphaerales bacterium]|nr:sulfatase [Phycisphaerales bacterium]
MPFSVRWIVTVGVGAAMLVALTGCPEPKAQQAAAVTSAPPAPYDVVIVLIDTLRADHLGVYGYDRATSPNLEALATEAVVFENASSAAPWTLPSVVSLQLSKFVCEHSVYYDGQRIAAEAKPMAVQLQSVGYQTANFYRNPYAGAMSGLERGFDLCASPRTQMAGREITAWLQTVPADKRFYLYVHNTEPHDPWFAEKDELRDLNLNVDGRMHKKIEQVYRAYRPLTKVDFSGAKDVSNVGQTDNTDEQIAAMNAMAELRPQIIDCYDARVLEADKRVGTMIDALKAAGRWDNTLFILLADHGEEFGEHGGWQHDQAAYNELVHVPLIVKLPKGAHAGTRVTTPVSLIDVFPTVMDVLSRENLAADTRGESFLPLIEDTDAKSDLRVVSMRYNKKKYFKPNKELRGDINLVMRLGKWKGILNAEVNTFELYDLEADPDEKTNVAAEREQIASRMRELGVNYLRDCLSGKMEAGASEMTAEDKKALKGLGYINEEDENP